MYFKTSSLLDKSNLLKSLIIVFLILSPFIGNCQTPTSIITEGGSPATYIYVGSLTLSSTNSGNAEKLKVDIFGGGWTNSNNGETTFYIGNRGGLSINEVTMGSNSISGYFTLHAYQNGNQTDFYLVTPANSIAAMAVLSYWYAGDPAFGTSQFITIMSSTNVPAGTEITPLTITPVMITDASGNIAVNASSTSPTYKFAINGALIATSATVKLYANWPDYVFKKDYTLTPLSELKTYINQNHHLPEMPTVQQIAKDGLNLGEINKLLVKKVEELTLYLIEKDKQLDDQQKINQDFKEELQRLEQVKP
jgi:hypothetical protein